MGFPYSCQIVPLLIDWTVSDNDLLSFHDANTARDLYPSIAYTSPLRSLEKWQATKCYTSYMSVNKCAPLKLQLHLAVGIRIIHTGTQSSMRTRVLAQSSLNQVDVH